MRLEPLCGALLASLAGCLVLGPWAIRRLAAAGWAQPVRHEDCPPLMLYQTAKRGTPTMGGLLVAGVAALVAAAGGGFSSGGWLVAAALVAFGGIGLVDDVLKLSGSNAKGLASRPKLWAALGAAAAVSLMVPAEARAVQVPWTGQVVALQGAWLPFAMLVVAGTSHAVNLTDGMDGLAAGCLAIAFTAFAAVAAGQAQPALGVWSASLAGACLGFVWFNSHPASVFLGDVGAMGLGGALGTLALLSSNALALVIVGGVFVAEAVSVMLQVASYRWRHQRRLFRVAPLHHHFQVGGMPEPKVVARFWISGAILAALGITALSRS